MDVRFEASVGSFVVLPGAFAVDLDDRTGAACLSLPAGPIALRPLRWKEKVRLARHAVPGAAFPDDRLLRVALGGTVRELAPPDRAAAVAVARWLNGLGEPRTALPLDAGILATVTVEVCRSLRLRPSDLDDRDASEVESIWVASRATSPGGESDDGSGPAPADDRDVGSTRILIVPDGPPTSEPAPGQRLRDVPPERDQHGASADASMAPDPGDPPLPATAPDGLVERHAPGDESGSEPPRLEAARYRLVDPATILGRGDRRSGAGDRHPERPPRPGTTSVGRVDAGRSRPIEVPTWPSESLRPARARRDGLADDRDDRPRTGTEMIETSSPGTDRVLDPGARPVTGRVPRRSVGLAAGEVGPAWTDDATAWPRPRPLIDHGVVTGDGGIGLADADDRSPMPAAAGAARRSGRSTDRAADELDELIEDFGERLVRAASQLGIGRW